MVKVPYEDRAALQELTHRYSLYLDSGQIDPLMALFTDDAIMDETGIGLPRAQGADALRANFLSGSVAIASMMHYVTNHVIDEFDGNSAAGICFVYAVAKTRDGGDIKIYGTYKDEYRKVDDKWRFSSRAVSPILPPELGSYEA